MRVRIQQPEYAITVIFKLAMHIYQRGIPMRLFSTTRHLGHGLRVNSNQFFNA